MALAGIGSSVEGLHAVDAAVRSGRVEHLLVEAGRRDRPDVAGVVERARASGAVIEIVDDVRSAAATTAPQGLVAKARPIRTLSLEAAAAMTDPSALVVLDKLEDPRNVGAIARSALAAGVGAIVIAERRAAPLEATAFKAAAGALEHVGVAVVSSIARALGVLGSLGLWRIGLDGSAQQSLYECDLFTEPTAIVLGAEGGGMSRLVAESVDTTVAIPLLGGVESLNASVAASLAVFELARVRASRPGSSD
jgi:23S rRNA (guanosine2251-2'-O)-methyltransferase